MHDLEAVDPDADLGMEKIDRDGGVRRDVRGEMMEIERYPVADLIKGEDRVLRPDIEAEVITKAGEPEKKGEGFRACEIEAMAMGGGHIIRFLLDEETAAECAVSLEPRALDGAQ